MQLINTHQAKTHLSKILEIVIGGEEVLIGKAGKPVAKLIPITKQVQTRKGGLLKGKIKINKDFDTLPKKFTSYFSK